MKPPRLHGMKRLRAESRIWTPVRRRLSLGKPFDQGFPPSSSPAAKPVQTSRRLARSWGAAVASDPGPAMSCLSHQGRRKKRKSRSLASLGMTLNGLFGNLLEHAPQLEKPFAVAGIADAAADEERAQGRFRQEAGGHVVRELAGVGCAIHLAELVCSDRI